MPAVFTLSKANRSLAKDIEVWWFTLALDEGKINTASIHMNVTYLHLVLVVYALWSHVDKRHIKFVVSLPLIQLLSTDTETN